MKSSIVDFLFFSMVSAFLAMGCAGCEGQDSDYDGYFGDHGDDDAGPDADTDEDGWTIRDGDCDDQDSNRNPGAEEDCDGSVDQDCDGDVPSEDDECVIFPQDGSWSSSGISFTVTDGGTYLYVTYADYGSCSSGGCSTSSHSECGAGSCETSIDNSTGGHNFSEMGCYGTFDSETTASGTCSKHSDSCGCTMSNSWTASI